MKKSLLTLAATALMLAATSCGTMTPGGIGNFGQTPGSTTTTQQTTGGSSQTGNMLGSLLNTLIGNALPMDQQSIIGTWSYQSPECRFESENFLAQAGGEVGAAAIEEKLTGIYSMMGIKPGSCSFTFNEDGTCSILLGKIPVNGTYTLDTKSRELTINAANGLVKLNGKVYLGLGNLTILFEADKLLNIVKTVTAFTGKGSQAVGSVNSLLGNYKGMQLGMNLTK